MTKAGAWSAILSGIGVLALLIFLVVQDQMHGWPFSRHHSMPAPEATTHDPDHASTAVATDARASVELPERQIEMLGIRFEPVEKHTIDTPVRAAATVVADESRITHVHARIAGWVEELYVSTTGQTVRAGQPLAEIFSQELYSSQQEYVAALARASNGGPASAVVDAARTRLELLGMDRAQIEKLERSRQVQRLVTIVAPRGGVVLNRGVSAGTSVEPSTELVALADLSRVWAIAEVAEGDAARLQLGSVGHLSLPMAQSEPITAKIEFIYPTLTERTRTVRVRLAIDNRTGKLRPGMYGTMEFKVGARDALTVARDAVVDTGNAQHVFVHTEQNVIEPRAVKIGARLPNRIEVVEGLSTGDHVAIAGVFLIDSESRLRASSSTETAPHAH